MTFPDKEERLHCRSGIGEQSIGHPIRTYSPSWRYQIRGRVDTEGRLVLVRC